MVSFPPFHFFVTKIVYACEGTTGPRDDLRDLKMCQGGHRKMMDGPQEATKTRNPGGRKLRASLILEINRDLRPLSNHRPTPHQRSSLVFAQNGYLKRCVLLFVVPSGIRRSACCGILYLVGLRFSALRPISRWTRPFRPSLKSQIDSTTVCFSLHRRAS